MLTHFLCPICNKIYKVNNGRLFGNELIVCKFCFEYEEKQKKLTDNTKGE
ncbi:MAG: hypothetical protein KatS3mg002_0428 [Candidatus Woesearchaeota archaeon]|nr:MAG: hypothetical protein KatS3mg002_0428 [Candidatus Woesearchaeota archaeon]